MARTTRPLTHTEVQKAKAADKDLTLHDGNGLFCKYPTKPNHSLLEIFRHTDYVPLRRSPCVKPDSPNTRSSPF